VPRLHEGPQKKKSDRQRKPPLTQTAEKSSIDEADFTTKPIIDKPPEVKTEVLKKREGINRI
jgi:sec-independent protein translocase protein TatA